MNAVKVGAIKYASRSAYLRATIVAKSKVKNLKVSMADIGNSCGAPQSQVKKIYDELVKDGMPDWYAEVKSSDLHKKILKGKVGRKAGTKFGHYKPRQKAEA